MIFTKSIRAAGLVTVLVVSAAAGQSSEGAWVGVGFGGGNMGRAGAPGNWGNAVYLNVGTPKSQTFLYGLDLSYWWASGTGFETHQYTVAPAAYLLASSGFFFKGVLGYARKFAKRNLLPDRGLNGVVLGLGVGGNFPLGERWLLVPAVDVGARGFSGEVTGFFSWGVILSRH